HRARGCRPGRAEPADLRHTRRLLDRLRKRVPRRRPADEPEPVPAELPVRGGHPRAARPSERPVRTARRRPGAPVPLRRLPELLGPAALVLAAALLGLAVSTSLQTYFLQTLVYVAIVVALYLFIGNSGVLSFGHIAFVTLGAWTAGVLTVP